MIDPTVSAAISAILTFAGEGYIALGCVLFAFAYIALRNK